MRDTERKCVLALGFFDGVHLGHAALLRKTAEQAARLGCESAVMTFDSHPDSLVLGQEVPLINSAPDRARLIRRLFGIDRVEFFQFTRETMQTPWDAFLDTVSAELHCVHFIVGYDFRFGWKGRGNAELLRNWCAERSLGCDVIDPVRVDGVVVSSTLVRTMLQEGDVERAARFMGHPHILTDTVRQGHRLGSRLGVPTVNMQFGPGVLVPRHGVYASRISLGEKCFPAVTNIGVRPTVSQDPAVTVESHLLDYSGNLYGRTLTLELASYLREEIRFSSLEELSAQIASDGERARKILEGRP